MLGKEFAKCRLQLDALKQLSAHDTITSASMKDDHHAILATRPAAAHLSRPSNAERIASAAAAISSPGFGGGGNKWRST
jgi:hypothetical protein